jgi:rSAM/selenodomain-associated transferase 2
MIFQVLDSPQISIIIPVLNEAENLRALLPWLQLHAHGGVRDIIVVDSGSTDESVEVAKSLGGKVLQSEVRGRAVQMNLGARAAQGSILYFVHADTVPPVNYALLILEHLAAGPHRMGCFRYRFRSKSLMLHINAWFTRFNFMWCQGGDKTFFIEKLDFKQLGGYDPQYCIMEEYDFIRKAQATLKMTVLPDYATVSARKYEQRGWLKVQIANLVVYHGWRHSVPPQKLARWYKNLLG